MKTVLITGGTGGIGKAAARRFSSEGWLTCLCARHIPDADIPGCFFRCDVTKEEDVIAMKETMEKRFHRLDALVLCAGSAWRGLIQDMPKNAFDDLMAVHLTGAFLCVKHFLPAMISARSGSIVFVSSMWGQAGASCEAAYSAAKAGQIGFAKALARECGPSGIRVNAVCPGYIPTKMNEGLPNGTAEQMMDETPLGRLGSAEDCADAIYFLCSDKASFITGQAVGVSGGMVI